MKRSSIAYGLVFIIIGIILLLFSYGILNFGMFKHIWKAWPLIFVVIGIAIMFSSDKVEEVKE